MQTLVDDVTLLVCWIDIHDQGIQSTPKNTYLICLCRFIHVYTSNALKKKSTRQPTRTCILLSVIYLRHSARRTHTPTDRATGQFYSLVKPMLYQEAKQVIPLCEVWVFLN